MIFYEVKYVTEDMASKVLMNSLPELGSKKSENVQLLNANLYEEVSVLTTMVCTAINENKGALLKLPFFTTDMKKNFLLIYG